MVRCLAFISLLFSCAAFSAPEKKLLFGWDAFDEASVQSVDHSAWQRLLDQYLIDTGETTLFKYASVTPASQSELDDYVSYLSGINPLKLNRPEQKAYWLNFYNALTVQTILKHYPVSSIRRIGGGLFSPGPWNEELVTVNGQAITLNNIEHGILRPIFNDARIHYGVNCASIGCPDLLPTAFTRDNTESLLTKGAKRFVNHSRGVKVDGQTLQLSSIYDWFEEDFTPSVRAHILQYANKPLADKIEAIAKPKYRYQYDWSLNEP